MHAGIDGEAAVLDPPLCFRIRPAVLTCRIARRHPGASPAAMAPEGLWDAIRSLAQIAFGRAEIKRMRAHALGVARAAMIISRAC